MWAKWHHLKLVDNWFKNQIERVAQQIGEGYVLSQKKYHKDLSPVILK